MISESNERESYLTIKPDINAMEFSERERGRHRGGEGEKEGEGQGERQGEGERSMPTGEI